MGEYSYSLVIYRDITPRIMEDQIEKNIENEMETLAE